MPSNENQIIEGCLAKDRTAQKELYELYSGKLFVVALRYMKSRDAAKDVLQDAFIKAFRYLHTFRFDCPLEIWLRRIVINAALKALKKDRRWDLSLDSDYMITSEFHYENEGLKNLSYQELLRLIGELPDGSRTIFNLYAIEGYKHHEISKMLKISEGTSKSQYSRAKLLLRAKISKEVKRVESSPREGEDQVT